MDGWMDGYCVCMCIYIDIYTYVYIYIYTCTVISNYDSSMFTRGDSSGPHVHTAMSGLAPKGLGSGSTGDRAGG